MKLLSSEKGQLYFIVWWAKGEEAGMRIITSKATVLSKKLVDCLLQVGSMYLGSR